MTNIVITGANRGIGLALSKHYQNKGWQVYGVCRNSSSALAESGAKVIEGIDVGNDASIKQLAEQLNGVNINILINNAGILRHEVFGDIDYSTIESQFAINALGPLKVSEALHGYFARDAKIVMISSITGSIKDNRSGGRYGYRMSKAALNCAAMSLTHDLRAQGISVGIIHPGLVSTDMIKGYDGDLTPEQAANHIAQRIEQLNLENSGTFWHANGEVLPW